MKWSLRLGRWMGIDVHLHFTFLLFLVLASVNQALEGGSIAAGLDGLLFYAAVFGCVLLHEFGHALAARRFGVGTRDITLLPIGGVARLTRLPDTPLQELWVALAGPAVNVVIAILLGGWLWLWDSAVADPAGGLSEMPLSERLLIVNIALVVFNMIPAFPMDGGRVLRAMLAVRMNHARATAIAAALGKGIAVIFAALGIASIWFRAGNPFLLLIAVFIWVGASQETAVARLRAELTPPRLGRVG